jgi:hypothetical protein
MTFDATSTPRCDRHIGDATMPRCEDCEAEQKEIFALAEADQVDPARMAAVRLQHANFAAVLKYGTRVAPGEHKAGRR